jgi:superfamily II DNA or RNA helicase
MTIQRPRNSRHHRGSPQTSPMQEALLTALQKRCQRDGVVVLPTGKAEAAEVAKVLQALDRERRQ